ncbi:MAG: hypothetical protein V4750_18325, partial [Pseudomonadota bacterium]
MLPRAATVVTPPRRSFVFRAAAALAGSWLAPWAVAQPAPAAASQKVLRYAIRVAETGFDPAQISDLYSSLIASNIFDSLYQYEFLARPVRLRPSTAVGLPE